jgi:hypothetical protein
MQLPSTNILALQKLSSVFKSTSATYKYYWLLAIIELIEEGNTKITKKKIFARMISNSWYTINYFHISFGKQDNLQIAVEPILKIENLTIDEKKVTLENRLEHSNNTETLQSYFTLTSMFRTGFYQPGFPT